MVEEGITYLDEAAGIAGSSTVSGRATLIGKAIMDEPH
jgi:hypothetical protein